MKSLFFDPEDNLMETQNHTTPKPTFRKHRMKWYVAIVVLVTATASFAFFKVPQDNDTLVSLKESVKVQLAKIGLVNEEQFQEQAVLDITEIQDASSEIDGKWFGLCAKKSVHSVEDFHRTVTSDPVLSAYYAGFNWESAKMGRLEEETYAFVAHKKGDLIKKTSKPIKLPQGDGYITDGERTARTYCCNDIVLSPSAGVPEKEVPATPPLIPSIVPEPALPSQIVPFFGPIDHSPSHYSPPRPHPSPGNHVPVPEPDTLLLFAIGLLVIAFSRKKH